MSDLAEKDALCRHLWDHGVLLSMHEFDELSVDDMRALDPCQQGEVA